MKAQLDAEFRDFMHARWPAMVRLAYALTGDQGHAEDVAQTAFARAYASWPKVRQTGNPGGLRPADRDQREPQPVPQAAGRRTADGLAARAAGSADATRAYDERSALIAALQRLGPNSARWSCSATGWG